MESVAGFDKHQAERRREDGFSDVDLTLRRTFDGLGRLLGGQEELYYQNLGDIRTATALPELQVGPAAPSGAQIKAYDEQEQPIPEFLGRLVMQTGPNEFANPLVQP